MGEREYKEVITQKESIFKIRNNLLTFSFTAVITVLGIALANKESNVPAIYLLPYFLLVPFTGRITYYRTVEARLSVFLDLDGEHNNLSKYNAYVKEKRCHIDKLIGILVNYEMFILSIACLVVCVCQYPKTILMFEMFDYIYFGFAIFCVIIIFAIITSAFDFSKIKNDYRKQLLARASQTPMPEIAYNSWHIEHDYE